MKKLLFIPIFLSSLSLSQVSWAELVDESLSDKIFMDGRIITSDDGAKLIKYKNKLYMCWMDFEGSYNPNSDEFKKSKLVTYCFDKN
ncbi:MAG: hypothetical protein ACPHUM_05980 [Candidatus Puniceispirillales bacterium]